MSLQIKKSELDKIFPFHLILSKDLMVESAGKSIIKLFPLLEKNAPFFKCWRIVKPKFIEFNPINFDELLGQFIAIEHRSKANIQLKGHFEYLNLSNNYVFFGGPAFTNTDQLLENNLSINDFSLNDSLVDLLHVLKNNEIVNNELKDVLNKLNAQKRDLKLFKDIIDSSSDAIQVGLEDGQLFYINATASERLGISMEECQNFKVQDFEKIFQINPKAWANHLSQLKSKDYLLLEGENINQTTGKTFPVEVTAKHINVAGQGMVIGISRDISERKSAEKTLIRQEAKYRNIISNMNLGLLEVDNNDVIKFCNKGFENISGFSNEELINKEAAKLFIDKSGFSNMKEIAESRKRGSSNSYEVKVINKHGDERWWLISGAPNFNDEGETIGSIGIHLDITEQKKLESELEIALLKSEEAAKAKESFLANMSHEIRTPLNAIIGTIRELGREKMNTKQSLLLRHSNSAANHLLSIVNSILDMSKIESGELELEAFDFSLVALLGNIESILKNKAESKSLDFNINIDTKIHPAHIGDASRLRQIFINLLDNAIKFTDKGEVSLNLKILKSNEFEQQISFEISDSGIGIKKTYLKNIFTKFSQEQLSTSRKYGGTGLGMPITYELVQLMNGEITVNSTKGKGTTFIIKLTLKKGRANKLLNENRKASKNSLSGIKVLLVEDNEMNRFIALQSLQFLGCIVEEAINGAIAIEKVKQDNFDIILMDIQMPEMDGIMATQIIRRELKKSIPIIAVTANAFKEDIDLYLNIGMNDYVTKPFEEYQLFKAISNLCVVEKPNTEKPKLKTKKSKYSYDLKILEELSHGNTEFIKKMVHIFLANIPESINEMELALQNKDYITISKIAHKIKPSLENLGISKLNGKPKEIELECRNENISELKVKQLTEDLINDLTMTIKELQENF